MKKNLLALSVAALVGGFSAVANAGVIAGAGGAPGVDPMIDAVLTQANATSLRFTPDGIGHILLVPYYTVQAGNATLLNLTNTDTVNGKAVKIRFRGALNSDDVFDFTVLMSPGDVWTATVTQGADGRAQLVTADNSCTLPASVSQSFVTDRLPGDAATKAAGTREGYIEIFNMADILPYKPAAAESIYEAIKHSSTGAVTCTASVLQPLANDLTTEAAVGALGLDTPTTGLMANWTIVNVPEASSWSGSAAAIVAENAGAPARGNFVLHPQTDGAVVAPLNTLTADPLLRTGKVGGAFFDLPDLSTPYLPANVGNADLQAVALTEALAVQSVTNEYVTDPSIAAQTSWVFSMPTRRYAVGVNYAGTTAAKDRLVFNENIFATGGAYATDAFFAAAPGAGIDLAGANDAGPGVNVVLTGDAACVSLGTTAISAFNRSEAGLAGTGFVISPGSATTLEFCGETTVLGFNQTSALGAAIAAKDVDVGTFVDGWARIATPGLNNNGLPVLGQSFLKATNPGVAAGVSGNFGASWDHRYVR